MGQRRKLLAAVGVTAVCVGALLSPVAAAAAPPVQATTTPVTSTVTEQLSQPGFGWVYKGFYRQHADCVDRESWYHANGQRARCSPLYWGNSPQPVGYNLFVRTRVLPDN